MLRVAAPDAVLVRLGILVRTGDMMGGLEEGQQFQRAQRRFVFAFLGLEVTLRPLAPARRLAVEVNQIVVVPDQMVGQARDRAANRGLVRQRIDTPP